MSLGKFAGLLAIAALLACEEPAREWRLPLPKLRIPNLHCSEPVEQRGDCRRDADCGEGQRCRLDPTVDAVDRAPVSLTCGAPLGVLKPRDRCTDVAECESGLCALAGVCLAACSEDSDCLAGQSCQRVEARVSSEALAPLMACARSTAFAEDISLSTAEPLALQSGSLQEFTFEHPGGDALLMLKVDCGRTLSVRRIVEASTGTVLFDAIVQLNGGVQPNPVLNSGDLVPVLLPNNPRLPTRAANYRFTVTVDADTSLQRVVASSQHNHSKLDLNVFYVGGGSMSAPGGFHPENPAFRDVLSRLRDRFAKLNIQVASVREYDVVGQLRNELGTLTSNDPTDATASIARLDELFSLSAGPDDGGLNLFVVRSMGAALGVSGGIPGALNIHGTSASGTAIALDRVGLAEADRTLFHELRHQLGLLHTTELDGVTYEPLADTRSCAIRNDRDDDGLVSAAECAAFDGENFMFWEAQGDQVSVEQTALLQRSLVLY